VHTTLNAWQNLLWRFTCLQFKYNLQPFIHGFPLVEKISCIALQTFFFLDYHFCNSEPFKHHFLLVQSNFSHAYFQAFYKSFLYLCFDTILLYIYIPTRQCQAILRPDILCILGAPNQAQVPITPSNIHTIQFIEFTYSHYRFPEQALSHKHTKYDPLINTI
jgi:hypothetical protein